MFHSLSGLCFHSNSLEQLTSLLRRFAAFKHKNAAVLRGRNQRRLSTSVPLKIALSGDWGGGGGWWETFRRSLKTRPLQQGTPQNEQEPMWFITGERYLSLFERFVKADVFG